MQNVPAVVWGVVPWWASDSTKGRRGHRECKSGILFLVCRVSGKKRLAVSRQPRGRLNTRQSTHRHAPTLQTTDELNLITQIRSIGLPAAQQREQVGSWRSQGVGAPSPAGPQKSRARAKKRSLAAAISTAVRPVRGPKSVREQRLDNM